MTFLIFLLLAGVSVFLCFRLERKRFPAFKTMRFGNVIIGGLFLTYFLWGLCVAWLLYNVAENILELVSPPERTGQDRLSLFTALLAGSGLGQGRMTETLSLLFNLWALLGAAAVLVLRINPWNWGKWKRIILGCLASGLLFGRPFVGWLSWVGMILPETGLLTIFSYTIGPPLVLFLAGGWAIQTALELVSWNVIEGFLFCVAVPVILFNQILQFDNALKTYKQQKTGLVGYIARFGTWLHGNQMPEEPDDSKGARFAARSEIEEQVLSARDNPKAAVFGHVDEHPLPIHTDKHVLIMASTRSGKGVSLIIPHLLRYHGSAFVLDPKGENARATGRHRAALNDKVHYLDPFGISGKPRSRFNPLARFTPDNMEAESKALSAALVMAQGSERDHWTASAQQLLAAVILHVVTATDIPAQEKDLVTVRRFVLRDINKALKAMLQSDVADGLLANLAASFLQTPEKEFGSILSAAQRQTEILDNPFIAKCLAASGEGDEVDFADWRKSTMTVYLSLSAPKFPVFSRWLRLVLAAALDEMTDTLNPPALPVCFMLDELATLGHLEAVENAVGLAAGYGVQLVTVFQDVAQMKDLYKGRWASFIGNAGVRALFNLDDYDTAKYWSNFMGGKLTDTFSEAQNIYGITHGQTKGEAIRPLLSPEEIMMQFSRGKMLVLPQGSHPIIADRVAYWNDNELHGMWDDPRQPLNAL